MLEKGIEHLKGADQKEWSSYRNKSTSYIEYNFLEKLYC